MEQDIKKAWDEVIEQWKSRCDAMRYRTTKERLALQAEYFTGAMAAMVAVGVDHGKAMPPRIILSCMTGTDLAGAEDEDDEPAGRVVDVMPEELRHKVASEMAQNWPEACELGCDEWQYDQLRFHFYDDDREWDVEARHVHEGFAKTIQALHEAGCPLPKDLTSWDEWEDWLCQSDAAQFGMLSDYAVEAVEEEEANVGAH
jgi:hypothetical protein